MVELPVSRKGYVVFIWIYAGNILVLGYEFETTMRIIAAHEANVEDLELIL